MTLTKALDKPFSEVISSTDEIVVAQCYKEALTDKTFKQAVFQGATVKIVSSYDTSYAAFGLIAKINNSSLDNIHKPSALGLSLNELEVLQPQVYDLLRKELEIYLFAHTENNEIFNYPPLKPMMVHDFVYKTSHEEILKLTSDFSSIISFVKRYQLKIDILVNLINQGYALRDYDYKYLVKVGQELSLAFLDDIQPLLQLLKRLPIKKK